MKYGFLCAALTLSAIGSTAQASCISGDEAPVFRQLKESLLAGNYDKFFEKSDHTHALPAETVQDTKTQLVQYLGVPRTCVTLSNRRYSDDFETTLLAFIGSQDQHLYTYFSLLKVDGVQELISVEISTDFSEIQRFLK
jgi:hypothetical protein